MSAGDVIARWVEQVGADSPRFLRPTRSNIVLDYDDRKPVLYSYGRHFVLAQLIGEHRDDEDAFFLVNGDRYSVTTSDHQSKLRAAIQKSGIKSIIIPFQSLHAAGILPQTIKPLNVRDDTWIETEHTAEAREDVPERSYAYQDADDGLWHWKTSRHVLGASVFEADWAGGTATFLSAFDDQERDHYFLAQLPAWARPTSYDEALEVLRPAPVKSADAEGRSVTRQGDIFGIEAPVTTRSITASGAVREKQGRLLGTSHTATETAVIGNLTYARGVLYHKPLDRSPWSRDPLHKRQKLGDGKAWHLIVQNTVPEGRSWSNVGRVD